MIEFMSLQIGIPGGIELLIVLVIVVLLFGASKLPELARSSGQAMGEFQRGRRELEAELKEGLKDEESSETREVERVTRSD